MTQRNCKLILTYSGTNYRGWQKTGTGTSVEGTMQRALEKLLQQPIHLNAASRTDSGVHAEKQVVNFLFKTRPFDPDRLNQILPSDIQVREISFVPLDFHATLSSKGKEYHYNLTTEKIQHPFERHHTWLFFYPLDLKKMQKAASFFVGYHNFSSFKNVCDKSEQSPFRTIHRIEIISLPQNHFRIEVEGCSFLYKMVRNIVGTLVYVGCGKLTLENAKLLLKKKNRSYAGVTAPAHGLILKKVFY